MVYEVILTERAAKSLDNINDYLQRKFGEKAIREFDDLLLQTLLSLTDNPFLGSPSLLHRKIRKFVMHKRSIIYYRIRKRKMLIEIIDIWDTRRKPTNRK